MSNDIDFRKAAVDMVAQCVCKDRNATYGSVEDNFRNIADLWSWWLRKRGILTEPDAGLTVLDVAQMMGMVKIARKLTSPEHLDNWIDDAGYSLCAASSLLKEHGWEPPPGPGMKGTTRDQREPQHAAEGCQDAETSGCDGCGQPGVSGNP